MAEVTPAASAMPTGAQAAAAYLRELLLRPGRYRRKWEQYAERSRKGQVNQLAVAEVLAHYLWEHPRAKGDADVLPRQLKDTASRALQGRLLSKATLVLFMEAFGLGAWERKQLLKLWEGTAEARVLSGPRAIRDDTASALGSPRLKDAVHARSSLPGRRGHAVTAPHHPGHRGACRTTSTGSPTAPTRTP